MLDLVARVPMSQEMVKAIDDFRMPHGESKASVVRRAVREFLEARKQGDTPQC